RFMAPPGAAREARLVIAVRGRTVSSASKRARNVLAPRRVLRVEMGSEIVARSQPSDRDAELALLFRAERRRLWALAYRLTGSAEDAEDVVQDAFARLVAQDPRSPFDQLGPWLVRVATNLGIDALRRRQRRGYAGPWLPSPIETPEADPVEARPDESPDPEARYGLVESATYAFLIALEALGPRQRAVLLLRDVLGHSARETADLVGTTEGSVRVLHLRARRALEEYDKARCIPTPELRERHRAALQ